jgi:hypothetical protein
MEFFGFRITKASEAAPVSDDVHVRFVGDLQRLEVRSGDRYVLTVPERVSAEATVRIRKAWEQFAGNSPLLILDGDMKVGAISMLDKTD